MHSTSGTTTICWGWTKSRGPRGQRGTWASSGKKLYCIQYVGPVGSTTAYITTVNQEEGKVNGLGTCKDKKEGWFNGKSKWHGKPTSLAAIPPDWESGGLTTTQLTSDAHSYVWSTFTRDASTATRFKTQCLKTAHFICQDCTINKYQRHLSCLLLHIIQSR